MSYPNNMPHIEISYKNIVFDKKVQTYCNNPKFKCPNYGHNWACPPEAPYLEKKVAQFKRFFLIYYQFDLNEYVKNEKIKHPKKSEERIRNQFYMKNLIRDLLQEEILQFIEQYKEPYKL